MPYTGTTFINVAGASSAAPGQTIQSSVWDNIHIDYAAAFTQLNSQYASVNTNRNLCWMNGGLEVFQRGAGSSYSQAIAANVTGTYGPDRWYIGNGANETLTLSAQAGLSSQSNTSCKIQKNAGQTGTSRIYICYPLDSDECVRMRGKSIYVNLLVKTGVNFTGTNFRVEFITGTGSPIRNLVSGYTSATTQVSVTTSASVSAQYQVTGQSSTTIGATVAQAELQISWVPVGTAGADDSLTIDDVSIEVITSTSTWTPMNYDRVDFPTMLFGCKRHYQNSFDYGTAPAANTAGSVVGTGTFTGNFGGAIENITGNNANNIMGWSFPQAMRVPPSSYNLFNPVVAGASTTYDQFAQGQGPGEAFAANFAVMSRKGMSIYLGQVTATSGTQNAHPLYINWVADASIQ